MRLVFELMDDGNIILDFDSLGFDASVDAVADDGTTVYQHTLEEGISFAIEREDPTVIDGVVSFSVEVDDEGNVNLNLRKRGKGKGKAKAESEAEPVKPKSKSKSESKGRGRPKGKPEDKGKAKAKAEDDDEDGDDEDYWKSTVPVLKELIDQRGVSRKKVTRKADLIALLEADDQGEQLLELQSQN